MQGTSKKGIRNAVAEFKHVLGLEHVQIKKIVADLSQRLEEVNTELGTREEELLIWEEKLQQLQQGNDVKLRLARTRADGLRVKRAGGRGMGEEFGGMGSFAGRRPLLGVGGCGASLDGILEGSEESSEGSPSITRFKDFNEAEETDSPVESMHEEKEQAAIVMLAELVVAEMVVLKSSWSDLLCQAQPCLQAAVGHGSTPGELPAKATKEPSSAPTEVTEESSLAPGIDEAPVITEQPAVTRTPSSGSSNSQHFANRAARCKVAFEAALARLDDTPSVPQSSTALQPEGQTAIAASFGDLPEPLRLRDAHGDASAVEALPVVRSTLLTSQAQSPQPQLTSPQAKPRTGSSAAAPGEQDAMGESQSRDAPASPVQPMLARRHLATGIDAPSTVGGATNANGCAAVKWAPVPLSTGGFSKVGLRSALHVQSVATVQQQPLQRLQHVPFRSRAQSPVAVSRHTSCGSSLVMSAVAPSMPSAGGASGSSSLRLRAHKVASGFGTPTVLGGSACCHWGAGDSAHSTGSPPKGSICNS